MQKTAQDLENADQLLMMLEQLCESFSAKNGLVKKVPWTGFSLTLNQVRDLIEGALQDLELANYDDGSVPDAHDSISQASNSGNSGALADRVQHVPTTRNRARELIGSNATKPGSKRAASDVAEH